MHIFFCGLQVVSASEYIQIQEDQTMSNEDKKQFISKQQDYVMRSNMINKHSGLFVEFFKARVELLIKQVLTKMWGVVDYFIRYEYQGIT